MEKSKAVIVKNGQVIAYCKTTLKNGASCHYAYHICDERINADRKHNLVNASIAHISRADKYLRAYRDYQYAIEINNNEFYINNDD